MGITTVPVQEALFVSVTAQRLTHGEHWHFVISSSPSTLVGGARDFNLEGGPVYVFMMQQTGFPHKCTHTPAVTHSLRGRTTH